MVEKSSSLFRLGPLELSQRPCWCLYFSQLFWLRQVVRHPNSIGRWNAGQRACHASVTMAHTLLMVVEAGLALKRALLCLPQKNT